AQPRSRSLASAHPAIDMHRVALDYDAATAQQANSPRRQNPGRGQARADLEAQTGDGLVRPVQSERWYCWQHPCRDPAADSSGGSESPSGREQPVGGVAKHRQAVIPRAMRIRNAAALAKWSSTADPLFNNRRAQILTLAAKYS